jgi:hypothetical protein
MTCEGCSREIGDLKALKAHRKHCDAYTAWSARAAAPIKHAEPSSHTYEGRTLPTMFG